MKQHIVFLTAVLLSGAGAAAQTINPTVEVTNLFEGSLKGIEKPAQIMSVPDSVMRFDLDFDYSVSPRPYQGAYDFQPYMVNMKPQASPYEGKNFFLRAGAGWTLHPELHLVYTPKTRKGLDINLFVQHNSYFGENRDIEPDATGALVAKDGTHDGRRGLTRLGLDGRVATETSQFAFGLGYKNLFALWPGNTLNGAEASFRAGSLPGRSRVLYDVGAKLDFSHLKGNGLVGTDLRLDADGSAGTALGGGASALLGFSVQYDRNSVLGTSTGAFAVIPQYRKVGDRSFVKLGVKVSYLMRPETGVNYQQKGQIVYPDVYLSYTLVPEQCVVFLSATGGEIIHSWSGLLSQNPFWEPGSQVFTENTIERVHISAGLRAGIGSRLQLGLKGGASLRASQMLDGFTRSDVSGNAPVFVPRDGLMLYARLDYDWISDGIRLDGHLDFQKIANPHRSASYDAWDGQLFEEAVFQPALLSGTTRFSYDWKGRIQAGIQCAFATDRTGSLGTVLPAASSALAPEPTALTLPGYVDLGVFAEVAVSRRFSLWAQGGNLLNQTIQLHPLIAERGPYVTAGLQLTF